MNTLRLLSNHTTEITTVPVSVQLLVPALLLCTRNITWITALSMFFCTVHIQQCRPQ